jgi:hypothetical protein
MLAGGIEIGHPLARMIGGRWIEPYCSDWPAIFAIRRQRSSAAAGNEAAALRYEAMAAEYLSGKRSRLLAAPPRLLIVDRGDGLVTDMLGRFGFQALLDRYERIAAHGDVELHRQRVGPVAFAVAPQTAR